MKLKSKIGFFIVVSISSLILTSCRAKRQETQKTEVLTETTLQHKETYKDTILWAPKSETSLTIPTSELTFKQGLNGVLKTKVFKQKSGNATANVTVTPDAITVQTTCDSLAIAAKIKSEFIKELQNNKIKTENIDIRTTGYTFWNILNWFIVGVIAGCFIGFQLKKSIDGLTNN